MITFEAITQSQYKKVMSEEDYPVVLGITNSNSLKVKSKLGKRSDYHMELLNLTNEDLRSGISWRYVPVTGYIYYWEQPNEEQDNATIQHLLSTYNYKVKGKMVVKPDDFSNVNRRRVFYTTSHSYNNAKQLFKVPSFKQYVQGHGYTSTGD